MYGKKETVENYILEEYKGYMDKLWGDEKAYIKNRLIKQIIWYDRNAAIKQLKYKVLTIITIILTALIPCLSVFHAKSSSVMISLVIALLGATASAISAIIHLCEFQKLWIEYRGNCEMLKSILHKYLTRTGEFSNLNQERAFNKLILSSEEYLTKEFQLWSKLSHSPKE